MVVTVQVTQRHISINATISKSSRQTAICKMADWGNDWAECEHVEYSLFYLRLNTGLHKTRFKSRKETGLSESYAIGWLVVILKSEEQVHLFKKKKRKKALWNICKKRPQLSFASHLLDRDMVVGPQKQGSNAKLSQTLPSDVNPSNYPCITSGWLLLAAKDRPLERSACHSRDRVLNQR